MKGDRVFTLDPIGGGGKVLNSSDILGDQHKILLEIQQGVRFAQTVDNEQLFEVKVENYVKDAMEVLELSKEDFTLLWKFVRINLEENGEFQLYSRVAPISLGTTIEEIKHNSFFDFFDTYGGHINITHKHDYLGMIENRDSRYHELLVKIREEVLGKITENELNEGFIADLLVRRSSLITPLIKKINIILHASKVGVNEHTASGEFQEDLEDLVKWIEEDEFEDEALLEVQRMERGMLKKLIQGVILEWFKMPVYNNLLSSYNGEHIDAVRHYFFEVCRIDCSADTKIINKEYDSFDKVAERNFGSEYGWHDLCSDHVSILYFRIVSEILDANGIYLLDEKLDGTNDSREVTIQDIMKTSPVYETNWAEYFGKNKDIQAGRIETYGEALKLLKNEYGDGWKEYIKKAIAEYIIVKKKKHNQEDDIPF